IFSIRTRRAGCDVGAVPQHTQGSGRTLNAARERRPEKRSGNSGLYRSRSPTIIPAKITGRKRFTMKFRTYALAGAALAVSGAVAVSATKQAAQPKGPLTSQLNQPWPAKVQTKQPKFPPSLNPAQEMKTFRMAPGFQVQLVASEPLVEDPIVAEFD